MTEQIREGNLTEQQKVRELYGLIGDRGLYVNTNFDVFPDSPEELSLAGGTGYKIPLIQENSKAYASPLLFATLTSLLNHGTMLVTGAPGIGKTTGAEFAGHFFTGTPLEEILASEIQGHPQLTEEKMVASYDIGKLVNSGEKVVVPNRFLQCPVKILDEGNRTPPDVLSIMMRLADSGKAVYGGKLLEAKKGPLFVTANYADEGTFQFTPPFLDRFDVAVMVTSPPSWDLRKIRQRGDEKLNGGLEEAVKIPEELRLDFDKIRKEIKDMPQQMEYDVPQMSTFADFVYSSLRFTEAASENIARATKGNAWQINQDNAQPGHFHDSPFTYTLNELSVRTAQAMPRYARAFAWINGDSTVTPTHLKTILPFLLWHKVQPTQKAITEDPLYANDRIAFIQGLATKIETDYAELTGNKPLLNNYAAALQVIRTGKIGGKEVKPGQIRTIVKNATDKIGAEDKSYAINLAHHIASEYNNSVADYSAGHKPREYSDGLHNQSNPSPYHEK